MTRNLLATLPLIALAVGCASMPPQTDETLRIQVFEGKPNVPSERIKEVVVAHGWGCGLWGATGSRAGAVVLLQTAAADHGADAVAILEWRGPGYAGSCRDNRYQLKGALLRLPTFSYAPPIESNEGLDEFRYTVQRGYDETWASLVDAVASSFFEVRNYEKESGLLTLVHDTGAGDGYIDCGRWKKSYPRGEVAFDGPYLDWLEESGGLSTDARINLRVKALAADRSEVEITALYRVRAKALEAPFAFKTNTRDRNELSENRALGTPDFRTCQATRQLERELLAEIESSAGS